MSLRDGSAGRPSGDTPFAGPFAGLTASLRIERSRKVQA
jgi:hypothetical protein